MFPLRPPLPVHAWQLFEPGLRLMGSTGDVEKGLRSQPPWFDPSNQPSYGYPRIQPLLQCYRNSLGVTVESPGLGAHYGDFLRIILG